MTTTNPRPLLIENDNNKLACEAFIQIHFAPPHDKITDKDFEKIFVIKNNGQEIFVKMDNFFRIKCNDITNTLTLLACGKDAATWAAEFIAKYPETNINTEMAVYCYRKIKI